MSKTLTKDALVLAVAEKTGSTLSTAHTVVQATLDTIQQALVDRRKVEFRNFGVFRSVNRKARIGRNPKDTSRVYEIPAHTVVKFKMGSQLETALNPKSVAASVESTAAAN
jgi:DNA-binding protein HU-beta